MKGWGAVVGACIVQAPDRRLEDAHYAWHACLEHYHDPTAFRINLNACIQALRNVTFTLQKQKAALEDFVAWYQEGWQPRLRQDAVMKWSIDSRNRIVKESDLETESQSRVTIVKSYDDAARRVIESLRPRSAGVDFPQYERAFTFPPRMNKRETLAAVGAGSIPAQILKQSTIVMERRWVDSALPDWELLTALAYAYSVLAELMQECHALNGLDHDVVFHEPGYEVSVSTSDPEFRRPPCMATTRNERSIEIDYETDEVFTGFAIERVPLTEEGIAEAVATFGQADSYPPRNPTSVLDWVQPVIDTARLIVAAGQEHEWHVMLFRGGYIQQQNHLVAQNRPQKRRLAQEMAEICDANGYDGILSVGEMWGAPITTTEDGSLVEPEHHEDRHEGIMVDAACADGSVAGRIVPFVRGEDGTVTFEEQFDVSDGSHYNFFAPVRAVWERWKAEK